MGNAGDNTKDNTTNSKIVSDELYLYSLKKMADLNAKKNESHLQVYMELRHSFMKLMNL